MQSTYTRRRFLFVSAVATIMLALSSLLAAGELDDIAATQKANQEAFPWIKCVSVVTHGAAKQRSEAETGPWFFTGLNELLPEKDWKPAVPAGECLWVKCGEIERFEQHPRDLKLEAVPGERNMMSATFGSARVLSDSTKGIKSDGVMGGGGMWENGDRHYYDTPFAFLDAGGGGNALSFANLVKRTAEGSFTSHVEHRPGPDGADRIRVVFQCVEEGQVGVWTYDLNPAHGMLPDEIRLTISNPERTSDSQFLIRHRNVEGRGWFPISCTRVVHSDVNPTPVCSIWRTEVKSVSFDKPADDDLKLTLNRGCILHVGGDAKSQFRLKEPQTVDIRAVGELIHQTKVNVLEAELKALGAR